MRDFCSGEAARVTRWIQLGEEEDATATGPRSGMLNRTSTGGVYSVVERCGSGALSDVG
jgi:hypothetical protein